MIRTGIVGVGPLWEERYGPVLKSLHRRITVRAVYNCVTNRAEQVASELGANAVHGIRTLMERSDIQAILWLDCSWMGLYPLQSALEFGKPIFLADSIQTSLDEWKSLYRRVQSQGMTAIPEMTRRYTPATSRLHELMATRLGKPRKILITIDQSMIDVDPTTRTTSNSRTMISLMDWCRYVMRAKPKLVRQVTSLEDNGKKWNVGFEVEFHPRATDRESPSAEIIVDKPDIKTPTSREAIRYDILCESGKAWFDDPTTVHWECDGEVRDECLQAERNELEVALDLFCRRVVGGLIPVADLRDICRGLALERAAWQSLEQRQPIVLNGEFE